MSLALYICSLPLFRIDRIEMVLDHTRKTFQEIFRYVTMVTSVKNLWTKIDHMNVVPRSTMNTNGETEN